MTLQAFHKSPLPWVYFASASGHMHVRRGAITAVSGAWGGGKTQAVARLLAENAQEKAMWIEPHTTLYPLGLQQLGVVLPQVLCARVSDDKQGLWVAHQALKSQVFGIVVLYCERAKDIELRRLQLAAEKSHTALIILSEKPLNQRWMLAAQIHIQRHHPIETLHVVKLKGA